MDAPLSNLDAKPRLEMRAEIRRIHTLLGCSTIYVTHDQDEAMSLADRIVVLRDGQVRRQTLTADASGRLNLELDGDDYEVGISSGPVLAPSGYRLDGAAPWPAA